MTQVSEMVQLSEEQKKRQRKRSIAIALALGILVAIFYAITLVKMGPGILNRPL
ncbi:MAG: hypothetical protein OIF56_11210 [Cohaesibacter sp.]|nr:hypothetical protein [Cohaesibacter sp.]MCV6602039.1 hypothetical protein [Cohaesibacter sp.]